MHKFLQRFTYSLPSFCLRSFHSLHELWDTVCNQCIRAIVYTVSHHGHFVRFCLCILRSSSCNFFFPRLHSSCNISPQNLGTDLMAHFVLILLMHTHLSHCSRKNIALLACICHTKPHETTIQLSSPFRVLLSSNPPPTTTPLPSHGA